MKLVVDFAFIASIIEFEDFLDGKGETYQREFEKWYYEITPLGNIRPRPQFLYKIFDVNVVIKWIKEVAPESNPVILVRKIDPEDVDPSLPGMYF